MVAILANARNFSRHSDYPLDKAIIVDTTSIVVGGSSGSTTSIPHGLTYTPLMCGSYSFLSDYSVLYGLKTGPLINHIGVSPFDSELNITADATNINFIISNYSASSKTFYIKYYGYMPSSVNVVSPETESVADTFQYNSDQNYTKLYLNSYVDQAAVGASPVTQSVVHGLGGDTQLLTWKEISGTVTPIILHDGGDVQIEEVVTNMDSTNINFRFAEFAPAMRVHYRVYIDE